eukprot:c33381_g1_i1 orf=1-201(-)
MSLFLLSFILTVSACLFYETPFELHSSHEWTVFCYSCFEDEIFSLCIAGLKLLTQEGLDTFPFGKGA